MKMAVYLLYSISEEYNLEISTSEHGSYFENIQPLRFTYLIYGSEN
jgi:hypothetical protein